MISEGLSGPRLLLVDDDETFCGVLGEALEKRGFVVRIAHNVPDARAVVQGPVEQGLAPALQVCDCALQ